MQKNVLILEDDINQLSRLEMIIKKAHPDINVQKASSYNGAINLLAKTPNIYFFMLDIDLGKNSDKKDGLDFAQYMRSLPEYEFIPIIYISSVSERALEAYKSTHCYEFIDKPYKDIDVSEAVEKMLSMPKPSPKMLNIKGVNGSRLYLNPNEIIFIEAKVHDLYIHTIYGDKLSKSEGLKNVSNLLPANFLQCHRSYIVNTFFPMAYNLNDNTLSINDVKGRIPVGRKYKERFKKLFEELD